MTCAFLAVTQQFSRYLRLKLLFTQDYIDCTLSRACRFHTSRQLAASYPGALRGPRGLI